MDSANRAGWGVMCDCGVDEAIYVRLIYVESTTCDDSCGCYHPSYYELKCPCCGRVETIAQLEDIPGFMEAYDGT